MNLTFDANGHYDYNAFQHSDVIAETICKILFNKLLWIILQSDLSSDLLNMLFLP
jgi:hypothetical protein